MKTDQNLRMTEKLQCFNFGSFYCCTANIFWQQQISWSYAIVPPVEHSVSWHDAIRIKRSVCHAIGMLLVA